MGIERIQYNSLAQLRTKLSIALQKHIRPDSSANKMYEDPKLRVLNTLQLEEPRSTKNIADAIKVDKGIVKAIVSEMRGAGHLEMIGATKSAKYRRTRKGKTQ